MWLLVGLGNPGSRYARTRHNIGFMVLDSLADNLGLTFKERTDYRMSDGSMENERIIFLEPLTFMNRSGLAVRKMADKHAVPPERIIVVHDDLDLPTGRLKIRTRGSSGGHKGIDSVIQNLGSRDFIRVKIGIGRDPLIPAETFVLSKFKRDELPGIKEALAHASRAIACVIAEGPDRAMNKFNI
ncbi:MAG TPA: aminoacyl-tRNA hydrolase [Thermodesulfovibrionales bacterium]|nr:aminoacyl-tRNA hydrolase [Thermodesulfovibrionales bacterium]